MSGRRDQRCPGCGWLVGRGHAEDCPAASGRCIKAEEALEGARRLLLDIEGSLLAYWTDIPKEEIQRLLRLIRETLGDKEAMVS